jgi:hypothetical protein
MEAWWALMMEALDRNLRGDTEIALDASMEAIAGNDPEDFAMKLLLKIKHPTGNVTVFRKERVK